MSSLYADFLIDESNIYYNPKEVITKENTEKAKLLTERALDEIGKVNIHEVVLDCLK